MEYFEKFIEIKRGSIPIIFTVPHGGTLETKIIPKRTAGILGVDKATIELAREFISYLKQESLIRKNIIKSPSYIISLIKRSKIDLNRSETEAYHKNSEIAGEIYQYFHEKVNEFISENLKKFKYSLLIDIHGFEKHKRPPGFRDVEIVLGTDNLASLFSNPIPENDWESNIRGKIINNINKLGIAIAPSHPRRKEYILTGGFIVRQFGASKISNSQSMQIEFSDRIRIYDDELRKKVLKALAEVLLNHIFNI